jgi:pyridoxine 4-dehydrogenase
VLRTAVESGVNHIDTSDYYGPHITNQIIREALHPYQHDLIIVTKIGARRGEDGSWIPALSPRALTQAVHDNLRNLGLDVLDVVNLRSMFGIHGPAEGSLEEPLTALADLQRQGLVRHIGLSNVTPSQIADGRRLCAIACVPMCRSSRSAGSLRCSQPGCPRLRQGSVQHPCRWRWRGCCTARPTSC